MKYISIQLKWQKINNKLSMLGNKIINASINISTKIISIIPALLANGGLSSLMENSSKDKKYTFPVGLEVYIIKQTTHGNQHQIIL